MLSPSPSTTTTPPSSVTRRSFQVGTSVEVRSNEGGLKGAWFEATVTTPYNPKLGRYTVTYTSTLLSDEHSSTSTCTSTESVHYSFVRPRPPPPDPTASLQLHHPVEAFHNHGWWPGVVTKLPPSTGADNYYSVCFPRSREELQFHASEVRPQLHWLRGKWVSDLPVDNRRKKANIMFSVGNQIEVSRHTDKYGPAWYVGTILKEIGKSNFLVEYENLRLEGDGSCGVLLQEIVDFKYIRPSPPASKSKNLSLLDQVEAFYQGGWFAGSISEILPDLRYIVKFKQHVEEMEFDHTAVRPCFVWTDGDWLHTFKDMPVLVSSPRGTKSVGHRRRSNSEKRSNFSILMSTPGSSSDVDEDRSGSRMKHPKKPTTPGTGSHMQPEAPKKSKKRKLNEHQLLDGKLMECGFKAPILASDSVFAVLKESSDLIDELHHSQGKSPVELAASPSVGKKLTANLTIREFCHGEAMSQGNGTTESLISQDKSFICRDERSAKQSKAFNSSRSAVRDQVSDSSALADWENCRSVDASREDTKLQRNKLLIRAPSWKITPPDDVDAEQCIAVYKKKRRRSWSLEKGTTFTDNGATLGTKLTHLEGRIELVAEGEDGRGADLKQLGEGIKLVLEVEGMRDEAAELKELEERIEVVVEGVDKRDEGTEVQQLEERAVQLQGEEERNEGNSPTNNINKLYMQANILEDVYLTPQLKSCRQVTDSPHYLTGKQSANGIRSLFDNSGQEVQNSLTKHGMTGVEPENQTCSPPLKEVIAQGCNELLSGTSRGSPSERAVVEQEKAVVEPSSKRVELPFTKKSSLWELAVSEEIFHIMPQQPHFQPLGKYIMEVREGMALGLMVSFVNLVADISKLRVVDSQCILEEKLKALEYLEINGFTVQHVRARLKNLLEIQVLLSESEEKMHALKKKMLERLDEKAQVNALVSYLDEVIKKTEEYTTCIREKRASKVLELEMMNKDTDLVTLERDVQAIEEACLSAEQQFNNAVAARW